ncbi:MAG: DUF502 domain-containing protein [Alphaproteobacteria bacterium]|nr:DUF502 domain-containing protein [Alphaproteobacteria bacterium]
MPDRKSKGLHAGRYLISGVLTIIPLWITWLVFDFVLRQLSKFGLPWVRVLARNIRDDSPDLAKLLLEPWFQNVFAVVLIIAALYLLGWAVNNVIGRSLVAAFESMVERMPLVKVVYGGVRKLIEALSQKPDSGQRVVVIDFPSPEMKAIGLATKTIEDAATGEKLIAVYVPTTPNPTSGYLELVPADRVISTDWTMDEAMNFLVTAGVVGPDAIHYSRSAPDTGAAQSKISRT